MACCQYHALITDAGESAFTVDTPRITFGPGCLDEVGARAASHGMRRVAVMTDPVVGRLAHVDRVRASLVAAGLDAVVYDRCVVEPTDASFVEAAAFARDGRFDGFVSVGGGSVIDTTKAANLLSSWPDDGGDQVLTWVNAPLGRARPVPGPMAPHIACPTTAGTGSEATGIAICDLQALDVKSGIASPTLRPTEAVVDPRCTATLPRMVLACSAFDVLCHALESFTARPYTARARLADPTQRPASQGANPWSDMGCREALRILGEFMVRGVDDAGDTDARAELMWAATLAGVAFGNCGVHVPHGMAYAVAGLVEAFHADDYPRDHPMVPHGMSVVVSAPAVFRATAPSAPGRHLEAAALLGAAAGDLRQAGDDDAGELLAARLVELMRACGMPNGLADLGYTVDDVPALVQGTLGQQRLLVNAPQPVDADALDALFRASMRCWGV